ncbi:MAG: hypothetical protein HC924_12675, partial [Synechococcaceae cyanobacterium SM2_3_2]|nr:hypothetical protein [Synechococcaceae cyanobacterium SM2_3_2]
MSLNLRCFAVAAGLATVSAAVIGCGSGTPTSTVSSSTLEPLASSSFNSFGDNANSISLYYDGVRSDINFKDAAVLFVATILNTEDPVVILNFINSNLSLFGVNTPITLADVNTLSNDTGFGILSTQLSDFTVDGIVDFRDGAVLLAIIATGSFDVTVIQDYIVNTLLIPGVTLEQAAINQFFD